MQIINTSGGKMEFYDECRTEKGRRTREITIIKKYRVISEETKVLEALKKFLGKLIPKMIEVWWDEVM